MTPLPNRSLVPEWTYLVSLLTGRMYSEQLSISLERVLLLAKTNNLLLAAGEKLKMINPGEPFPDNYEAHYQRAKSIEENTQYLIQELLTIFEKVNLPILTIKSFLPFPYADSNTDVVMVESHKADAYLQVLAEHGYQHWFSLADWREPRKKNYYVPEREGVDKTYPMLHLHRAISWNGVEYLALPLVWSRHRMLKVGTTYIPVPSFEDEVLIMAAHAIFENKFITLNDLLHLQWLADHSLDWDYIIKSAEQFFWDKALYLFLFTGLSLAQRLDLDLKINLDLPPFKNEPFLPLPYVLPMAQTFDVSWQKLGQDLASGNWCTVLRQLFSYTFVDGVWMYRKAWRKQSAVKEC